MLASDLQQPVVSQTSVLLDLLHALNIVSDLGVQRVGTDVDVSAVPVLLAPVQEPGRHAVGAGVGDDLGDLLPRLLADLARALLDVHLGQLADQVRESATDALDGGQGVGDAALALDVGVEHSDDQFELGLLVVDKALTLLSSPWLTVSIYKVEGED